VRYAGSTNNDLCNFEFDDGHRSFSRLYLHDLPRGDVRLQFHEETDKCPAGLAAICNQHATLLSQVILVPEDDVEEGYQESEGPVSYQEYRSETIRMFRCNNDGGWVRGKDRAANTFV
jgi:hypothetical protein